MLGSRVIEADYPLTIWSHYSIVVIKPNFEEVLQGPRSFLTSVEIEGVMQHEISDAWRHSFRMVRAPRQCQGDSKPSNYVSEALSTWTMKRIQVAIFKGRA